MEGHEPQTKHSKCQNFNKNTGKELVPTIYAHKYIDLYFYEYEQSLKFIGTLYNHGYVACGRHLKYDLKRKSYPSTEN
jgi:hypothetical protein